MSIFHHSDLTGKRLLQIGQALFYIHTNSLEKLPVCIARDFFLDEEECLWFTVKMIPVTETDWVNFPAELFFYRKEMYCSIKAEGLAALIVAENAYIKFRVTKLSYRKYTCPQVSKASRKAYSMHKAFDLMNTVSRMLKPARLLHRINLW